MVDLGCDLSHKEIKLPHAANGFCALARLPKHLPVHPRLLSGHGAAELITRLTHCAAAFIYQTHINYAKLSCQQLLQAAAPGQPNNEPRGGQPGDSLLLPEPALWPTPCHVQISPLAMQGCRQLQHYKHQTTEVRPSCCTGKAALLSLGLSLWHH